MKAVLKDVAHFQGEVILFIDELHNLVGAGAAEGSIDASNMLKNILPMTSISLLWLVENYIALEPQPPLSTGSTLKKTLHWQEGFSPFTLVNHLSRILSACCVLSRRDTKCIMGFQSLFYIF